MSGNGTALVTGGSAGIGLAFATALAARGEDLVLVARNAANLEETARRLRATHDVDVETMTADLADRAAVQRVAERLADSARPVDTLINNAGFGMRSKLTGPDLSEQERAIEVMCRAVLVLGGAAGRAMRSRGHGAIVNLSSVAGFLAMGGYSAIKAWVMTYSESLAVELAGTGVTVTAACPGFVRTEFHQRAAIDMSRMPRLGWVDVDDVVATTLRDIGRRRVISIPSARFRAISALARHAPRGVIRRVSTAVLAARNQ